jgi:hypothetical protein
MTFLLFPSGTQTRAGFWCLKSASMLHDSV